MSSSNHSTSFVVDFDDGKSNRKIGKVPERFVRGHFRNMSLPVGRVHPFKNKSVEAGAIQEKSIGVIVESSSIEEVSNGTQAQQLDDNEGDSSSEGGTYTVDKDDKKVKHARSSIDKVFGIQTQNSTGCKLKNGEIQNKKTFVTEWIEHQNTAFVRTASGASIEQHNAAFIRSPSTASLKLQRSVSKIPSPIVARRGINGSSSSPRTYSPRIPGANDVVRSKSLTPVESRKFGIVKCNGNIKEEFMSSTERYLKETESIVCAIQKRLDSGTDSSDVDYSETGNRGFQPLSGTLNNNKRLGSACVLPTRYNRTLSLRRERLNTEVPKAPTPVLPREKKYSEYSISRSSPSFSKTDLSISKSSDPLQSRSSTLSSQSTSMVSLKKAIREVKKKISGGKEDRSKSALSPQQIEFQNWKRRKSYDPMKAAAQGRKKSSEKKSTYLMTRSTSSVKSISENGVLRSASFHIAHNRNDVLEGYTSAEESDLLHDDEEYRVPKPPSTSLENSPRGSRLSLSNGSSSSLLFSNIETVDVATINAITQMSVQLKQASCRLVEKLSEKTTEENKKSTLLNEIDRAAMYNNTLLLPPYNLNVALDNLKEVHNIMRKLEQFIIE